MRARGSETDEREYIQNGDYFNAGGILRPPLTSLSDVLKMGAAPRYPMRTNPLRLKSVGKAYKPRFAAWGRKTVRMMVILHKRRVRHAAKQYLKTGHSHDQKRMESKITNWDFD